MVSLQDIRNLMQDYSLPLLLGILVAIVFANISYEDYNYAFGKKGSWEPGHLSVFGHHVTISFLVNDIFMCFFFGLAAKEVVEAFLPGGSLDPPSKAINPVAACIGGVVGPVIVFFILAVVFDALDAFDGKPFSTTVKGWGIPTATDIALAWMVASQVFKSSADGKIHPAVNYLLLMAVIDDAIGLIIIAVYYTDPNHPPQPVWLLLCVAGMLISFGLRKLKVRWWAVYVILGGVPCWCGLLKASVHPALALIPIVPFMPDSLSDAATVAPCSEEPPSEEPQNMPLEESKEDTSSPVIGFEQFDEQKLVVSADVGGEKSLVVTASSGEVSGAPPPFESSVSGAGAGSGNTVIACDVEKDSACTECKVFQGPLDVVAAHQKQCTGHSTDGFDEDGRAQRREMVAPIHAAHELHEMDAPLHQFEHQLKLIVDIGLFFFSLCNAGVKFSEVGAMTVTVLVSLIAGKTLGVVGFAMAAAATGKAPVPEGITTRDLWYVGFIASLGLTVALFVAGEAFEDLSLQSQAKMGALLSGLVGFAAIGLARMGTKQEEASTKYIEEDAAAQIEEGQVIGRPATGHSGLSRPGTGRTSLERRPGGRRRSLNVGMDHRLNADDSTMVEDLS